MLVLMECLLWWAVEVYLSVDVSVDVVWCVLWRNIAVCSEWTGGEERGGQRLTEAARFLAMSPIIEASIALFWFGKRDFDPLSALFVVKPPNSIEIIYFKNCSTMTTQYIVRSRSELRSVMCLEDKNRRFNSRWICDRLCSFCSQSRFSTWILCVARIYLIIECLHSRLRVAFAWGQHFIGSFGSGISDPLLLHVGAVANLWMIPRQHFRFIVHLISRKSPLQRLRNGRYFLWGLFPSHAIQHAPLLI
jgi:hypothetical protein